MATMENLKTITLEADAGLISSGTFDYYHRFVDVNSDGEAASPSAGGKVVGVALNKPGAAGQAVTIAYEGVAKVVCGTGGLTAGGKVTTDADGGAVAATSSDHVVGTARTTASAGEKAEVLLVSQHLLA